MPQISVLIPLYRGTSTIVPCLDSLLAQEGVEMELLMLDNGCPEGTGEWAGYHLAQIQSAPKWKILEEPENTGFAAGNNLLYAESSNPFVLFLNQDVELDRGHLKILADALQRYSDWGGVTGTLFRKTGDDKKFVVDTSGHEIFRDRIVRNRGAGMSFEAPQSVPWDEGVVFGVSAACALFKRDALESSRDDEGPFDPGFFSYFEDVDLDYRMRRAGWDLGYVPGAHGTHVLAGSGGRKELKIRLRAYGNRRRILLKHESFASLAPDLLPVILQDIYGTLRSLLTDPLACIIGPWHVYRNIGDILRRKKLYDKKWGTDMSWIRQWLLSETERVSGRG